MTKADNAEVFNRAEPARVKRVNVKGDLVTIELKIKRPAKGEPWPESAKRTSHMIATTGPAPLVKITGDVDLQAKLGLNLYVPKAVNE